MSLLEQGQFQAALSLDKLLDGVYIITQCLQCWLNSVPSAFFYLLLLLDEGLPGI